jgi:GNAT superfamily N-acetyltransferase
VTGVNAAGELAVERLTPADRHGVVDVLAASFRDYPVWTYALAGSGEKYDARVRALVGFFCDFRFAHDWPVLGARADDALVGVALLSAPGGEPPAAGLAEQYAKLVLELGPEAVERIEAYEAEAERLKIDRPHYLLGMLGVTPAAQGRGIGRRLLNHVHRISASDPNSAGVCLSTEDPANVSYYEKAGYRVVAEADIGEIHTWLMFRPDSASH